MNILDQILAHKRDEVARRKREHPLAAVRADAERAAPPRDLVRALRESAAKPALIAEVKRASPSRGLLAPEFDPVSLARTYEEHGAAAVSVLTDRRFFRGHLDHLRAVRREINLPILRKDFLFDPYQVYEARAAGADAVLLIAAVLSDDDLRALHHLARELGMAALVEVHDGPELERALRIEPHLVGVNNRNLHTFEVSLETTARLRPLVPAHVALVAESGIHSAVDVARLARTGADAVLVGEALVAADDTAAKVRELTRMRPRVKICGITNLEDALAAAEAGADMLGFNFYPHSKRYVTPETCHRIVSTLRQYGSRITLAGVFVNAPLRQVESTLEACGLDVAQLHGDESPRMMETLNGRAFKAIRPTSLAQARSGAARFARPAAPALLIDAHQPGQYGGTGHTGDWALARALADEHPILLAGGLNPDNVAAAVAHVRPWGVDAASGVETEPGRKDAGKMAAFVKAARL